jgi:nitrite reductase (cytochrome c-552)
MADQSNTSPQPATVKQPPAWRGWAMFLLALIATFLVGLLGSSILNRREEAKKQFPLKPIAEWETDSAVWGENYPREYGAYKEMYNEPKPRTKYGNGTPRRDYLEQTPANVILFAGYGFAKEYMQARAHVFTIDDVTHTHRLKPDTPATCFTCKSPDVPRMMHQLGGPDGMEKGAERFYASSFADMKKEITHPIGCLDCHEPNTMKLRISRPALRETLERQGRKLDDISHQEMRSLVCAQCHVTYYFKPKTNYLTFPWSKPDKGTVAFSAAENRSNVDKTSIAAENGTVPLAASSTGTAPEDIEKYFAENDFSDFTNAVSKTPMLKMRHPDYEVYSTGIHAYRNVACADCHMPYRTEGGVKFTNHHLQSPLYDISNSCAVCHRWSEDDIRNRVYSIQDKVHQGREFAEGMLAKAHLDIAAAMQAGATDEELANVRKLIRSSQLRWDYVAANNGMGFHSPLECERILAASVDLSGQCRVECARILAKHGHIEPVNYPDYSTKEKAEEVNKLFIEGKPPKLL